MNIPSNDARALHDLLEAVSLGNARPMDRWSTVLGAEYETLEFARRHAEVLSLFLGTMTHVASLPDRSRERAEKYTWAWWMAAVAPQHGWSSNVIMQSVVDENALDQLGSTADLIDARMAGSLASAQDPDLEDLRLISQEWIEALLDDDDLAGPLKLNLLQDLHHLIWLIEHADLFGVGRVTSAAEQLVGTVMVAGDTITGPRFGEWRARGKKLIQALVLIGGIAAGVDTSFMLAAGAGNFAAELMAGSSPDVQAPGPITGVSPPEGESPDL